MKYFFLFILLSASSFLKAQTNTSITIIDFVKIKDGLHQEANYFYENNWKVYRVAALKKGFIKSYKLLQAVQDSMSNFDLMLMTEYTDSVQYKLSEERFQGLIKEMRPTGPLLLNDKKPNDFRQNVFSKRTKTLFE